MWSSSSASLYPQQLLGDSNLFAFAPSVMWDLATMASVQPHRAQSLAQSVDDRNFDGSCTWEEALAYTDGMKVILLGWMRIEKAPVQLT